MTDGPGGTRDGRADPLDDYLAGRLRRRGGAESERDLTIDGPTLAAQAMRAGLVDDYHLFVTSSVVGGSTRFFPDGVRLDLSWSSSAPSATG